VRLFLRVCARAAASMGAAFVFERRGRRHYWDDPEVRGIISGQCLSLWFQEGWPLPASARAHVERPLLLVVLAEAAG